MFIVTAVCLLTQKNKPFWCLLLILWCLLLAIYEYYNSGILLCGIWLFNAYLWHGSYKKHRALKILMDEKEKDSKGEFHSKGEL